MSTILKDLDVLSQKQRTIDALLEAGDIKKRNGDNSGWTLEPLYSGEECDMGFVRIDKVEAGRCPDHIHEESVEYLVVLRGEILFSAGGRDLRVVREGEMAKVNAGEVHNSKPLVDDTKLAYICVPKDPGMKNLTERINNVK